MRRRLLAGLAALLTVGLAGGAAPQGTPPAWSKPTTPFRIVGPIYYVGTEGIAAYLIQTRDGLILLDGGLEESVPTVEGNIVSLGFRLSDVKLMIATHAHWDHAAGLAKLQQDTGARFLASAGDRQAYETGVGPSDMNYDLAPFPPVRVDEVLVDGRPIRLGEVAMTPVLTPGHTPGCTSWTMKVEEHGRLLDVVFPCSITVAGNKLVGNKGYPGIVADYRRTFLRMGQLPSDVVLPAHPEAADVLGRGRRRASGDPDAFFAFLFLQRLVIDAEKAFEAELKSQENKR